MGVEEPRLIRLDSDEPEEYVLSEGETRIGRSRANAICLRASTVSRFHCYLVRKGDEVRVFDGKSKNPARLNGEPVSGQRLRTGQVLVVGKAEFVYQGRVIEEAPAPAAPAVRAVAPVLQPRAAEPAAAAWTRPETDAAMHAPAPRARRPRRRRQRVRSREPAMIATLVLLLAVPAVVWVVVAGMRSTGNDSAALIPAADTATADLIRQLQAKIDELERMREDERVLATAESKKRTEELTAQILEMNEKIDRAQTQPANPADKPQREAPETPPWERPREPPGKLYGTFSIPEELPREPTTVVIPQKPPLVRRRLEEVRDIQKRLERNLQDYATHVITPATLAPDLEKLWLTEGRDAAAALLDLEKDARGYLRETDGSIELNRKRKEDFLAKARSSPGGAPPSSDPKPYPKYAPDSSGRETDQRWLDAFDTAMKIHGAHRKYLEPLRKAILEAIGRVSAPEGLDALRIRFTIDDDEELGLAIAGSFEGARWHESIPVLAQRLSSARSDRLRAGLRKALTALVGEDLGDRSAPWLEWWKARR